MTEICKKLKKYIFIPNESDFTFWKETFSHNKVTKERSLVPPLHFENMDPHPVAPVNYIITLLCW